MRLRDKDEADDGNAGNAQWLVSTAGASCSPEACWTRRLWRGSVWRLCRTRCFNARVALAVVCGIRDGCRAQVRPVPETPEHGLLLLAQQLSRPLINRDTNSSLKELDLPQSTHAP